VRTSKIKREGDYTEIPKMLRFRCNRLLCTICKVKYGAILVAKDGKALIKAVQALDHIWPVRFLLPRGLAPHREINIVSICATCHGSKLKHETRIFAGDVYGYLEGLRSINYPLERIREAAHHYRFREVEKFLKGR
jgi:hypothetical protein